MRDEPSKSAVEAWIALNRAQQTTMALIERGFREQGLPPYAWYDALWALERAGDGGLRPFELERCLLIAQSNISRLIDRMKVQGAIERRQCADDGRGHLIVITTTGRDLRARMWPIYAECIRGLLEINTTELDRTQLVKVLEAMIARRAASNSARPPLQI
ncbi:DNA-binding MarR family transcriptional regulator [Sphingomonas sp. UYAg733]